MDHDPLWERYRATRSCRDRDAIILRDRGPSVLAVAKSLWRQAPAGTELDELISVGDEALIRAVEKFDVARSSCWRSFAVIKVRHAILDFIRRRVRERRMVVRGDARPITVYEDVVPVEPADVDELIEPEKALRVGKIISRLPLRERRVLFLVFVAGLSDTEIAKTLRLPFARVRMLRGYGLYHIKARTKPPVPEPGSATWKSDRKHAARRHQLCLFGDLN